MHVPLKYPAEPVPSTKLHHGLQSRWAAKGTSQTSMRLQILSGAPRQVALTQPGSTVNRQHAATQKRVHRSSASTAAYSDPDAQHDVGAVPDQVRALEHFEAYEEDPAVIEERVRQEVQDEEAQNREELIALLQDKMADPALAPTLQVSDQAWQRRMRLAENAAVAEPLVNDPDDPTYDAYYEACCDEAKLYLEFGIDAGPCFELKRPAASSPEDVETGRARPARFEKKFEPEIFMDNETKLPLNMNPYGPATSSPAQCLPGSVCLQSLCVDVHAGAASMCGALLCDTCHILRNDSRADRTQVCTMHACLHIAQHILARRMLCEHAGPSLWRMWRSRARKAHRTLSTLPLQAGSTLYVCCGCASTCVCHLAHACENVPLEVIAKDAGS